MYVIYSHREREREKFQLIQIIYFQLIINKTLKHHNKGKLIFNLNSAKEYI